MLLNLLFLSLVIWLVYQLIRLTSKRRHERKNRTYQHSKGTYTPQKPSSENFPQPSQKVSSENTSSYKNSTRLWYSNQLPEKAKTHRSSEIISDNTSLSNDLPIAGAYQPRWLFSYNEKYAYTLLKPIAEELGYTVFAKVRLLDLIEPVKGIRKYKTYFYKIQAKHVDFVLCDQNLVAEWIIELDDSSHDRPDRQERDRFVDEAVTSVGYKILHVRQITPDIRDMLRK